MLCNDSDWDVDNAFYNEEDTQSSGPLLIAVRRKIQCRRCGKPGFFWKQTQDGWRLSDPQSGEIHSCTGTRHLDSPALTGDNPSPSSSEGE